MTKQKFIELCRDAQTDAPNMVKFNQSVTLYTKRIMKAC